MDWNDVMKNELKKAGLDVKVQKVPKSRCASNASNRELNQKIDYRCRENEGLCLMIKSIV